MKACLGLLEGCEYGWKHVEELLWVWKKCVYHFGALQGMSEGNDEFIMCEEMHVLSPVCMGRHDDMKSKTLPSSQQSSQHRAGLLYPTTNPNSSKTVQATDSET